MKILFIGDIVGRGGRDMVRETLHSLRKKEKPDLVIANCENLSHGNGFTGKAIEEMQEAGVNFFTNGNHVWGNKDGVNRLGNSNFPVIRPANYPGEETPGEGYRIIKDGNGKKILIANLMGRVFMKKDYDCPFRKMDQILKETSKEKLSGIFLDFHAEATAEKIALAHYLDGRVSAVIGTHTHVPTADCQILEKGTAFMSDAGMVGPTNSVIGVKKEIIIQSFLDQMPVKYQPETTGKMIFSSVMIEVDEKTKKALNIYHIQKFNK